MRIFCRVHIQWAVAVAYLLVGGCGQRTAAETVDASVDDSGGMSGAVTSSVPRADASGGVGGDKALAAEGGRTGTEPATRLSAGSGAASGSVSASAAGASGSMGASVGAAGSVAAAGTGGTVGASTPSSDASVDVSACEARTGTADAAGFVGDWTPGTYPEDFTSEANGKYLTLDGLPNQAGLDREYAVHVPLDYDKGTPLPALFCLHAFSMNARSFCVDMAGWPAKADKEKLVVIMPNGYQNSWNIGEGCGAAFLPVHTEGIDDVGFVRALLTEVGKHVNIDVGRVYATGFSNGSSLAWRLACDAADIFTAVVPVAAGSCLGMCKPSQKVSVLDVYGSADSFNPTPDLPASMSAIQMVSGCSANLMPAALPMSTGAASCLTAPGCSSSECSPVEVTQCIVENGNHCWFGDISTADCGAGAAENDFFMTNLAWKFLERLSR
jgi:polyhydroxybutyrate depolymerase